MNVHAIINPTAGGGYSAEIYPTIMSQLRRLNITHSMTTKPGDAEQMAQKAVSDGVDYLFCIGGDGTLNEVVQALQNSDTVLVPISGGTGSDFVKTLGYRDMQYVLEAVESGNIIKVDLGVVQSDLGKRFFINILEVGFGAKVMKRVNSRRKIRGGASFTSSVLATLPTFRPYRVRMILPNADMTDSVAEIVVANGRYFGGGMLAAPSAELTDGLLDIHVVQGMNLFRMMAKLRKLRDGSYVDDPAVRSYRADSVHFIGDAPVEIDGEDYGQLPVMVSAEKLALKVLAPSNEK